MTRLGILLTAILVGGGAGALAATPLETVRISADTTVDLGAVTLDDAGVGEDDLGGTVSPIDIGPVPGRADVDAFAGTSTGEVYLSFDTTVILPGAGRIEPADVVVYDGGVYSVVFSWAATGLSPGVDVDAVAVKGTSLLLSFDVTVDLGTLVADDEDLVLFDGAFSLFFDGSAAGVPAALDLDAAHYIDCNDHLLLSFDGSGTIGGLRFADEDLVEYNRAAASWEMAYDGSAHAAAWGTADLDAADATVDAGPGPPAVFGQTIRAGADKISFHWTNPVAYEFVRGAFATSAQIGNYQFDLTGSGSGSSLSALATPAPGTGSWYLVKPGSCTLSSWQSSLGAEPGRDMSLP